MSLESLFSAVSPQSTLSEDHPGKDALLDLALACKGMPDPHWHSLLWRYLRDDGARGYLYSRLGKIALQSRSPAVRDRAGPLARLVLALEHSRLDVLDSSQAEHVVLDCTRRDWREKMRPELLRLRARLDQWARAGGDQIKRRLREPF